jgi:hypothetical protein
MPSKKVFESQTSGMNTEKQFLKTIEDMERFLRAITAKQEFWSDYLLDFLLIPGEYLITLLEEKDRFLCLPKSRIYGSTAIRHNSYAQISARNRFSVESEIVEESSDNTKAKISTSF